MAKILNFLYPFFLAKIGQEKVFGNILDRKPVFLDFQYIDFDFYPFFLAKIGQEKVFGNVLDRKPVFLDFQYIG